MMMLLHYGNITLEALEALEEFLGTLCVITMVVTMEINPLLLVGALEVCPYYFDVVLVYEGPALKLTLKYA